MGTTDEPVAKRKRAHPRVVSANLLISAQVLTNDEEPCRTSKG
jgi:hypothetical protein